MLFALSKQQQLNVIMLLQTWAWKSIPNITKFLLTPEILNLTMHWYRHWDNGACVILKAKQAFSPSSLWSDSSMHLCSLRQPPSPPPPPCNRSGMIKNEEIFLLLANLTFAWWNAHKMWKLHSTQKKCLHSKQPRWNNLGKGNVKVLAHLCCGMLGLYYKWKTRILLSF